MTNTRRLFSLFSILLALTVTAAACGSASTNDATTGIPSDEPTKIRFLKSNRWDAGTGGAFFSAVEEGYFDEEGIDVEPQVALGAATGIAALISGSAEIGQSTPDAFLNGVGGGADLVAVWQWIGPEVFGLLANGDAGISSIADLEGKTIGIISRGSATLFSTKVQLAQAGLTENDVEIVALGCCSAQYTELLSGNVDAVGTWDGQHLTIQQTAANDGEQAWLDQTEVFWNLDYLGDIFVTTRSFFEENEAAVVGFARGMQRGQQFELDNPQAALENVSKHVEGVDPSSADDLAQLELRAASWNMGGGFDYPGIEKALGVYYDTKLTSVHPGALDLSRLFIQEVPDQVAAG